MRRFCSGLCGFVGCVVRFARIRYRYRTIEARGAASFWLAEKRSDLLFTYSPFENDQCPKHFAPE